MSQGRGSPLERLLEQTARLLSGGGIHPVELLQRTQAAVQGRASGGMAPNLVRIGMHEADYERYRDAFEDLRYELDVVLDRLEQRERWQRIGDRIIEFELSHTASPGLPAISASFADTTNRHQVVPAGETQVIRRLRGVILRLGDGSAVKLTHTPFRIGRGPGNDLVYPSLALSRSHAEIASVGDDLEIRDLGSRNGVLVSGRHVASAILEPGVPVVLGDLELWVEYEE